MPLRHALPATRHDIGRHWIAELMSVNRQRHAKSVHLCTGTPASAMPLEPAWAMVGKPPIIPLCLFHCDAYFGFICDLSQPSLPVVWIWNCFALSLPSRANISHNKTTNHLLGYAASAAQSIHPSIALWPFASNPMLDPSAKERDFFFFRVF